MTEYTKNGWKKYNHRELLQGYMVFALCMLPVLGVYRYHEYKESKFSNGLDVKILDSIYVSRRDSLNRDYRLQRNELRRIYETNSEKN
ncbi:MAG: hypothetical protein WC758_05830 [Candidatus Woesearchaeota archaeon]|jgi:hypothetical protein